VVFGQYAFYQTIASVHRTVVAIFS
jgi:hypothetical protein